MKFLAVALAVSSVAAFPRGGFVGECPAIPSNKLPFTTLGHTAAEEAAFVDQLASVDFDAVEADIVTLLTDSQDFWPADGGHYGGFLIRLAWHCAGSYRQSDGVGGCEGGRIRHNPELAWPDNGNLDKALQLLQPIKDKYGDGLSWGDLITFAGTVAIKDMEGPVLGFCAGRVDDSTGEASTWLGPSAEQKGAFPCPEQGLCEELLGTGTVGLIYVNPGGPKGEEGLPSASARDIRNIFGRMSMGDRETVALVGGGHAFGKTHGACSNPPCGSGKGEDTFTSGWEGPWTFHPDRWDNSFFEYIEDFEWELVTGPGGNMQWAVTSPATHLDDDGVTRPTSDIMMLTSDLALGTLGGDPAYIAITEEFKNNPEALDLAFKNAWYKLVTRDMGPYARCHFPAGWEVPPQPFQFPLPAALPPLDGGGQSRLMHHLHELADSRFVHLAFQCAATFRQTDYAGGCNGARIRFAPQKDWNTNHGLVGKGNNGKGKGKGKDQGKSALAQLVAVQEAYGDVSLADLIVAAGTVSLSGNIARGFCPGRADAISDQGASAVLTPQGAYDSTVFEMRNHIRLLGFSLEEYIIVMSRPRSGEVLRGLGFTASDHDDFPHGQAYFQTLLDGDWKADGNEFRSGAHYITPIDHHLLCEDDFAKVAHRLAKLPEKAFQKKFAAAWTKLMNADRLALGGNVCTHTQEDE